MFKYSNVSSPFRHFLKSEICVSVPRQICMNRSSESERRTQFPSFNSGHKYERGQN